MIAVIDYGMGNIASILNMFKRIGNRDVILTKNESEIRAAKKIILPGVGAFDNGMNHLKDSGLIPVLNYKALEEKTPVLGICLGMQLLLNKSEEGTEPGLGWIDGEVIKFDAESLGGLKVPHMGWNYIELKKESPITDPSKKLKFYFVHSYYAKCKDRNDVIATCNYGIDFDCMIQRDNIYGAQFHPEKSHKFGMDLFERFSKI